ncbi:AI-2E family transporter [Clostridium swellfunianum]|uniref:AI-2E family transporter n=1 Tax=Clostridium swellfunianum TaxID=1367462 RepID=UPI002030E2EB|nr:AI-2E family transporter [Clostridium swellfunianum]MCM0648771.1 AI-2E family transporter [Clostridium swellfunianum]
MKRLYNYLIIILISILVIYLSIKSPVVKELYYLLCISFVIAYSLRPLLLVLVHKGFNKRFAVILILTIFVAIAVGAVVVVIPSLFKESLNINNTLLKIQLFVENLYERIKPISSNKTVYVILDSIYTKSNSMLIDMFNKVFNYILSLGENMLSLAVVPLVVYYFLADSDVIFNRILVIFPSKSRNMIKKIIGDIDKILGRYIISQFVLCAIIGVLTFVVLIVLHVDFPIILSVLNALFNIIPYFGPLFGGLPAVMVALLYSGKTALWTAAWLYLIQQIEGNIISPKITGDSVSMHPLVVIILLIVGGKLGGFLGMVLAVPIGVVIKIIYEDLNYYLF